MFRCHQHHLPQFFVRLKSGGDAPHPVVAEELLGRAVQHVAEVGETVLGVGGASQRDAPLGSPVGGQTGRLQGGDAVPAQAVEHGCGNKQGRSEYQLNLARLKQGVAEFAKLIPRLLQRPRRVVGRQLVAGERDGGTDALLVDQFEPYPLLTLGEVHVNLDAAIRTRLFQQLAECLIVVAVDLGTDLEPGHVLRQQ
ncbi:hypothetical protein D3C79_552820 [compost metagenome]